MSKEQGRVSFIIIVKNQENTIQKCLNSIYESADEIAVVDTGSNDGTLEVLRINLINHSNLKLFDYEWEDNFSSVRNFALKKATSEWIFFIDSDEVLNEKRITLMKYLDNFENYSNSVISIYRTSKLDNGKTHEYEYRIFKNEGKFKFYGYVHEEIRYLNNKIPEKIKSNIRVSHFGYLESEMKKHRKLKRNTRLLLKNIEYEPKNQRWLYLLSRDGQNILGSKELVFKIISRLFDGNLDFSATDIKNLKESTYKADLIINLCLLYIDLRDLKHAKILTSMFTIDEIRNNPDLLYCQTIINIIELYVIKSKLLNNFIEDRNRILESEKVSKIDAMNHNLDDLMAYLLFDTKNYSLSKDYFELLKKYKYPTLFIDECKMALNM